jgi:hypothetical protein
MAPSVVGLTKDLDSLERRINGNKGKIERPGSIVGMLPGLAEIPPEELVGVMFEPSSYDFFQPSDFTYRSMRDSGDFRLLSDSELKKNLLRLIRLIRLIRLYRMIDQRQQNFIQALDDSYIPLMMGSFDIATMKLTDPTIADNQTFRNFFPFALQDIQDRVAAYEAARKQVEILLSQIAAQSDPA